MLREWGAVTSCKLVKAVSVLIQTQGAKSTRLIESSVWQRVCFPKKARAEDLMEDLMADAVYVHTKCIQSHPAFSSYQPCSPAWILRKVPKTAKCWTPLLCPQWYFSAVFLFLLQSLLPPMLMQLFSLISVSSLRTYLLLLATAVTAPKYFPHVDSPDHAHLPNHTLISMWGSSVILKSPRKTSAS